MTSDRLLCAKEIAARLGCSERTVSRMYSSGKLPKAVKLNGKTSPIKIRERDLKKVLRGRR